MRALGDDPLFRRVQDEAVEGLYYNTSQRFAAALGLRWAPGRGRRVEAEEAWGEEGLPSRLVPGSIPQLRTRSITVD